MKQLATFLALALAAFALVACGGDDDNGGDEGNTNQPPATTTNGGGEGGGGAAAQGQTLQLSADPGGDLAYDKETLTAQAGNVTIEFDNPAAIPHDVAVEDDGGSQLGKSDIVTQDSTSVTIENMKPGTYTFYCSVPGHREAGMEGTLRVR